MAEETTPPPEADPAGGSAEAATPQPEAEATGEVSEEAPAPEADASGEDLEEAPEPAEAELSGEDSEEGSEPGEAPEPSEDAAGEGDEGESSAPAAAPEAAPAQEEEPEEELEPAYPPWAFKVGLFFTVLSICGITYFYYQKFDPKLKEVATLRALADNASLGDATAQLELAKQYRESYDKSVADGAPARPMLIQAYAWLSLATRAYLEEEDKSHGHDAGHGSGHDDGHKDAHGAHGAKGAPGAKDSHGPKDTKGHDTKGHDTKGHDTKGHDTKGHDTKDKLMEDAKRLEEELDSERGKNKPDGAKIAEIQKNLDSAYFGHGMQFYENAEAKNVPRKDKKKNLMLAYKWFSFVENDHPDANATEHQEQMVGKLTEEFGVDYVTQAESVVEATKLMAKWRKEEFLVLDPNEEKAVK
ncbi:MAG: hypothetical protein QGG55_09725, partial [Verrucomicrobiota bacterium]|nr:hypothetical protein [Verrucomicrobiota bacterium]